MEQTSSGRKSSLLASPLTPQPSTSLVEGTENTTSSIAPDKEDDGVSPELASETASNDRSASSAQGFCPMCRTSYSVDSPHSACSEKFEFPFYSGNDSPWSLVVRFRNITVTADQTKPRSGYDTFGKKLLSVFLRICKPRKKATKIEVLKNVSGYIMPGSMTLVLGPPGSGKSMLLKVIGGELPTNRKFRLDHGDVLYNNNVLSSKLELRRPIAYITQQENVHLPFLTVRETIEFVQTCAKWKNARTQPTSLPDEALNPQAYIDYILQIFGLKEIENRRVGTPADGIKDSDRNRLTTAEVALGTYSLMLYDQPSSGQDSLITYDLLKMLRSVVHLQQCAAMMSLVQISPESFDLFDRVILLSEGQVMYQGPRQDAENYFLKLGFKRPAFVDTATFLQDIASGLGGYYMDRSSTAPSIEELLSRYTGSDHHKDVLRVTSSVSVSCMSWAESSSGMDFSLEAADVLVNQVPESGGGKAPGVLVGDKVTGVSLPGEEFQYATSAEEASKVFEVLKSSRSSVLLQIERPLEESRNVSFVEKRFRGHRLLCWWFSTRCLIKRQITFTRRLKVLAILRLLQVLILGLYTGSLFYHKGGRLDQYEMNSMRTTGFISMLSLMLLNVVQLPIHIMLFRPVFYKQQAQRLFCPSSYVLAHAIVNIPQSLIEATVYSLCIYFLASLSRETSARFFQYWGVVFLLAYLGSVYMLFAGAIAPILETGTTLAGLFIAINLLFSGATILPSVVGWYWRWILYIIPTRWGNIIFTSTQVDKRYELPCMSFRTYPFCLLNPTLSLGRAYLKYYEVEGGTRRLCVGYAVISVFIVVLGFLAYFAYSRVRLRPVLPVISKDQNKLAAASTLAPSLHQAENGGATVGIKWDSKLSAKPVTLSFHGLKLTRSNIGTSSGERVVLSNISGYTKPGTMLAIVGSTRSGKETLLNCIAGRPLNGTLEGDVLVNGFKLDKLSFCRISGFVEKQEAHQQFLTVKETLEFSAKLRLGESVKPEDKARHVEQILELFGLSSVRNQLVGNLKLVSSRVDEMTRKLSIAVELAVNPSILFLDDPTVRLDGVSCREILKLLQSVALSGRTIISTLDHPSGEALSLFNDVVILKLVGQQVYFGPIGWNCKQLLEYFASLSKVPPYNEKWNPVTYILDVLGGGIKKREPAQDFALLYQQSPLHRANLEELEACRKRETPIDEQMSSGYPASYTTQAAEVFLRNQRFLWRNIRYTLSRFLALVAVAFIMGTLYLQMDTQTLLSMTSASLFPYIQLIMIAGLISNNVIPQLGTDRLVYYRENRARVYAPILYPVSWAAAEVPYLVLGTLVYVAIGNGLANLAVDSISVFFSYWLGLFLFTLVVTYFGIFLTFLFPVPLLAVTASSIFTSIWIASSGVSIPRYNIQFYQWLYWINPYQYAVNILTAAAFYCDTATAACKVCTIGADCPGCSCKRLVDLEAKLVQLYGPIVSQMIPASFVWDRMSKARVIERGRNHKDYVALFIMLLLFATLATLAFARLKHNSTLR